MALTRLKSPGAAARWLTSWVTGTLRTDSRQVQPGDGFIAWPGQTTDGRSHVAAALAAGASTCLVEADGVDAFGFEDARIAALPAMKAAAGVIADAFFQQPSRALRMLAVTGTNGKTSTTWWMAQALGQLGSRCAVVGTLGLGQPPLPQDTAKDTAQGGDALGRLEFTGRTTPDPVLLQGALRRFVDQGFAACAMEATSIGIVEHRLAGVHIDVAVLTNFTPDHLDYHGSMAAYWEAKRALFSWPGLKAAVINVDDAQGAALTDELESGTRTGDALDVWTYSTQGGARLRAVDVSHGPAGLAFTLLEQAREGAGRDERAAVETRLIGLYNVSNLLAVVGGLRALGIGLADAVRVVADVTPVPGRMQRVRLDSPGGPVAAPLSPEVVVDYAHTPDALDKALAALRPMASARGGRLWCVFGCGGNRDASKRPLMGAIAARAADEVIVTTDNPRDEVPGEIIGQVLAGLPLRRTLRAIEDRRTAIATALRQAGPADVVLLAGKGHEDYQEVHGTKLPFSDLAEAQTALAAWTRPGANA